MRDRQLAHFSTRDAGRDPSVFQGVSEPVGVTATVSKKDTRLGQIVDQDARANIVAGLGAREEHPDWPARGVGDGVEL